MSETCRPEGREELILEKLRDTETMEGIATSDARELTNSLLMDKGFSGDNEIVRDKDFTINYGGKDETVRADFIITLDGQSAIFIKCSMAVDSSERHVIAIARCLEAHIIPFTVITDGIKFYLYNSITGKLVVDSKDDMPNRDELSKLLKSQEQLTLSPEKLEKEMRIVAAFECAASKWTGEWPEK